MYILSNMWFQKLMKQFFFGIDQVVYNAISSIYDLLISIARTSVFTQADILDMADRIYKLLAIFMIFKVTLSLITYVVNPDDFSDKSKGISKLSMNIVISLGLLILTPTIFNMAFRLQKIILEDNTLATLIFGEDEDTGSKFINTAGDEIAFITMSAFFTPNTSINEFQNCIELTDDHGNVNPSCTGLDNQEYQPLKNGSTSNTMYGLTNEALQGKANQKKNTSFSLTTLQNYVVGVNKKSLGLMFRQEMAVATVQENTQFVMDYKYIFSTAVGVVIVLLLISFCMDVALRSIKLGFLQLIAPIPILSYVDPKSGKDGMFKKWYQLCFKTYLSLFIRFLALYFAVYIIEKVADMKLVDVVDGSYQTHAFIYIFVIIGALMFAKDLPKILEGLGIKLDGGGKFTLNPLKKFEESAAGAKNITGMTRGALTGLAGAATGAGIGRAFSGAWRGMTSGKGWKETGKAEAEMNRKMRQAKLDGSTFGGRMSTRFANSLGLPTAASMDKNTIAGYDAEIAKIDQKVEPLKRKQSVLKEIGDTKGAALKRAQQKIVSENAKEMFADLQDQIRAKQARVDYLKTNGGSETEIQAAEADLAQTTFKNQKQYVDRNLAAAAARRKGDALSDEATAKAEAIKNGKKHYAYKDDSGKKYFAYENSDGNIETVEIDSDKFEVDSAITDIQENISHLIKQREIRDINADRVNDGYTDSDELFGEVASFGDIGRVSDMAADESRLLEVGEDHVDNVKASKKGTKRTAPTENVRSLNTEKEKYQQSKRDLQTSEAYKQHQADESAIK